MTIPLPDEPFHWSAETEFPDAADLRTLRASGPPEVVQVIPYVLGFHPENSVVLLGLRGRQVLLTARYDLEVPAAVAEPWCRAAAGAGADRVLTAIYSEGDPDSVAETARPKLPHVAVLDELSALFARHGLSEVDALLVRSGRWWSYRCQDSSCCDPGGTPVARDGVVAAEAVARGLVALPAREELERELQPDVPQMLAVTRAAFSLVEAERADEEQHPYVRRADDWSVVRRVVRRAALGGVRPTPEESARVLLALEDVDVRDATIGLLRGRPDPAVSDVWRDLTRAAPAPIRAPVATLHALWCYAQGSGARTNIALDVALAADPTYSMAHLLGQLVATGANPVEVVADLGQEGRRIGRRIQRRRDPRGPEARKHRDSVAKSGGEGDLTM